MLLTDEDGYFGQETPPLTDEIKEILEEYPDGQIFKVSEVLYVVKYVSWKQRIANFTLTTVNM